MVWNEHGSGRFSSFWLYEYTIISVHSLILLYIMLPGGTVGRARIFNRFRSLGIDSWRGRYVMLSRPGQARLTGGSPVLLTTVHTTLFDVPSYQPSSLHSMAKSILWNRFFLGLLKRLQIRSQGYKLITLRPAPLFVCYSFLSIALFFTRFFIHCVISTVTVIIELILLYRGFSWCLHIIYITCLCVAQILNVYICFITILPWICYLQLQ